MKTKNNEMRSRKTIIRIFSAVLLFASLAFVASSCCKDDIPEPKPEKVVIVFGVDTGEGHLEAKVDDVEIKSRTEIEKGKTVVFNASHSKSWKIKYWKINGVIIRSVEPTQTFENVNEHMDVRLGLEKWITLPTE